MTPRFITILKFVILFGFEYYFSQQNKTKRGCLIPVGSLQQRTSEPVKAKPAPPPPKEDDDLEDEDEEEHGDTFCGTCGGSYTADEFWIGCDICEKWYHGKCVKITPARAEHIKQYKCPACSNKRART